MGLLWKKIEVADNQRALLFNKENFQKVLGPGEHKLFTFGEKYRLEYYDVTTHEFSHKSRDFMFAQYPELLNEHLEYVQLSETQVGLVYLGNVLRNVLVPGSKAAYWKSGMNFQLEIIDIEENFQVDAKLLAASYRHQVLNYSMFKVAVPDEHIALLVVDGKLSKMLSAGTYAYWKYNRNIVSKLVDLRVQSTDVAGQEILTKDRVSLRINLSASYKVVDPEAVIFKVKDYESFIYRELQLALREAVGTKTLDELLENKDALNNDIKASTVEKLQGFGVQLFSVGVKDIILPGDMKIILNQVVEAQKEAEANLIKRREETQAMRSLHNTAKVMENNPMLLRLKELEALERMTSRIDKFTVYNGLEGILNDVVKFMPKPSDS